MKTLSTARLARVALCFSVAVIGWGALVRATGSGAGCGSHWPLCNGEVLPVLGLQKTFIEFFHRVTSLLSLLLCLGLVVVARREYPRGAWTRKAAAAAGFLILLEAVLGAGLVLWKLVEQDQSLFRVLFLGVHLLNTFALLAALTLCGHWAVQEKSAQLVLVSSSAGFSGSSGRGYWREALATFALFSLFLKVGAAGGITALGDTLFPAHSLAEGFAQDWSSTSHFLIQLRIWHPALAVVFAGLSFYVLWRYRGRLLDRVAVGAAALPSAPDQVNAAVVFYATCFAMTLLAQMLLGLINLLLLAPLWLQISHLLLADLLWIFLVLMAASFWVKAAPKATSP